LGALGDVGKFSSLQLDQQQHAQISYLDATTGYLKYLGQDTDGWHAHAFVYVGVGSTGATLALDTNGLPHFGYDANIDRDVRYAAPILAPNRLYLPSLLR